MITVNMDPLPFGSMDRSPVTRSHWKIFTISSMGMFLNGYDLSVITLAMVVIPHQIGLSTEQYLAVNASAFAGMLMGAPIIGRLADRIGRRRIFGLDLILFVVFAILSGLSTNFLELFSFRFMLGLGIGGDYPVSSTMVSEFSPTRPRGKFLLGMVAMYWVGALFSSLMNVTFINNPYFWRYTFIIGGLIAIPVILVRLSIPESPRWLISRGRIQEAEKAMQEFSGAPSPSVHKQVDKKPDRNGIFSRKYAMTTFFILSAWFLFDVAAYGMGFYFPRVISTIGFAGNLRLTAESGIIIDIGGIAGYAIGLPFADRLGRRFLTIAGFTVMSVVLLAGSIIRISGAVLVPYFFVYVLFEQWIGAVTLFYPTELYPTGIRATAQGVATAVSRAGAIMGIVIFPLFPVFSSLYIFAALSITGLVISVVLAPETRRKSLEAINPGVKA